MRNLRIYLGHIAPRSLTSAPQDLLRPESENLAIREHEAGGVFVAGVHQQEVTNIVQCLQMLAVGDKNRTTAFTALNAHSSRSHAVVMLTVIKRRPVAGTGEAEIQRVKVCCSALAVGRKLRPSLVLSRL
jgi:kinesin family protein 5